MEYCIRTPKAHWRATALLVIAIMPVVGRTAEPRDKLGVPAISSPAFSQPSITWNSESGQAILTNGPIRLVIETKSGINACSLCNVKNGQVYADRGYVWSGGRFPTLDAMPVIAELKDGNRSIAFKGRLGSIAVEQVFTLPKHEPGVVLEQVAISNPTDRPLDTADFHCGFAKHVREGDAWSVDASEIRMCPLPYRRETNGQMQEWPLREIAEHGITFAGWVEPPHPTPIWGAEGWVWSKGASSFLVAKFNPEGMEWSLMEPVQRTKETVLRFGGAGRWKHGHPEGSAFLEPHKTYRFGETRLQSIDGDWRQAYYANRRYLESKGRGVPKTYNPPVHWNELYDNQYFFTCTERGNKFFAPGKPGFCPEFYVENKQALNKYCSLDLMKAEAAKAKELGCEALYLDPGWEIGPNRQIWDTERLGSMTSFVKMVREQYGLKGISLWCSLAGVPPTLGDPSACPKEARVLNKEGRPVDYLVCQPCPGFLDTKEKWLLDLCRDGALFLMFDATQYSGPCYDKTHGHSLPSTREEHARGLFELARRIKAKYPNVLIEMHDPITGPCGIHYTPTHFGYNPPESFDCLWGHEFMWDPLGDLLSGRALSLYYYNMAYSIPLYLHVSLKQENEHALVFWWYASTCRHLGVGGKPGPVAWEADKRAMQAYMPLKRFYTQGRFYGIEETVHAHTLPDLRESVLNVFNPGVQPIEKELRFRLADIGLPVGLIQIDGGSFTVKGDEITMRIPIPARGHRLMKVKIQ
jgi:hypothetical protein